MLVQIRRGYTAACFDLRLSVETDAAGWQARVLDGSDGRTVYSAQRCSLGAAKLAATEFAAFRTDVDGQRPSPEAVAQQLSWSAYWSPLNSAN
jgi:hypothetical protein